MFLSLVAAAAEEKTSELNVIDSVVQGLGLLLERGSNFGRRPLRNSPPHTGSSYHIRYPYMEQCKCKYYVKTMMDRQSQTFVNSTIMYTVCRVNPFQSQLSVEYPNSMLT